MPPPPAHDILRVMKRSSEWSRLSGPVIRAHVVLRGKGGVAATDRTLTAQRVEETVAAPQTVAQAKRFFESHGFAIRRVSPTSIIVEASPQQFHRVFKAKPKRLVGQTLTKLPTYAWSEYPRIPDDLKDVVAEVVFPRPAALT